MVELSNERIDKILHEETLRTEDSRTLLRAIIDKLNDKKIAEFRKYHEETKSLLKYYYMDIPHDVNIALNEFDNKYTDYLLGNEWHSLLLEQYNKFKIDKSFEDRDEDSLKNRFAKQNLNIFYEAMNSVFRDDFDTSSKTAHSISVFFKGLLFGNDGKKDQKK